ncbi:MAG: nuclear transport factor 2 family protein [Betaproteobacteria bacterium]|nr:nuclear transport factor 2 family protein [Betaproteobacteria bacterium]
MSPQLSLCSAWCLAVIVGFASLSSRAVEAPAAGSIEALEMRLNDALMACDARELDLLWDDELTFVFPNGVAETKAQRIAGQARCTPGAQRSVIDSVAVRPYGDTAVAVVLTSWSSVINGKPFAAQFRATHVWALRTGRWKMVAAQVSQLKAP